MLKQFVNIHSIKKFMVDVPKGTFSIKKHKATIHKSFGKLDVFDYVSQLPYVCLLFWIPIFILFLTMCLLIDGYLITYHSIKTLMRNSS